MRDDVRGFTLIECMVVVALCAVLMTLTYSTVSFVQRWLARADIDTLTMVCRYAQQHALITQKPQVITFDVAKRSYTFNDRIYYLAPGVQFGTKEQVKGPPAHPTQLLTNPITFANNKISFSEAGVISAGTVYITDKQKNILYALSSAVSHTSYLRTYVYTTAWQPIM